MGTNNLEHGPSLHVESENGCAQGFLYGLMFSAPFWIAVAVIVLAIMYMFG